MYRIALGILTLVLLTACHRSQDMAESELAHPAHFSAASSIELARKGDVTIRIIRPDSAGAPIPLNYRLQAPHTTVEDTDIRGFLDGEVKYDFNQATSYHMRIGRRYGGKYQRRFELKRSLIRWSLPDLQFPAALVDASIQLWVERTLVNSPLNKSDSAFPLYLYAYQTEQDWNAGAGGIDKNDFSPAAPGEVTWLDARNGELAWPSPGGLRFSRTHNLPYLHAPLALGVIDCTDCRIDMSGGPLIAGIAQAIDERQSFDVLLKLEDAQEDRFGTESGIFSSNFGHAWDIRNKHPALNLTFGVPGTHTERSDSIVLETGSEIILPRVEHWQSPVIIDARFQPDKGFADDVLPTLWIRGGRNEGAGPTEWFALRNPVYRSWDWSQIKVSARPHETEWGEPVSFEILETWVKPEPRTERIPRLYLVAPSGKEIVVLGTPTGNLSYEMQYEPNEFGLWKYRWSFRPTPVRAEGSHVGEGAFYVSATKPGTLKSASRYFVTMLGGEPLRKENSVQLESLVRASQQYLADDPSAFNQIDGWLHCARLAAADPSAMQSEACATLLSSS